MKTTHYFSEMFTQRCNISVSDGEKPGNSVCIYIYIMLILAQFGLEKKIL